MNFTREDIHSNLFFWLDVFTAGEKKVFYDIGAHRGEFTHRYAPQCKEVIAFEPDPENLKYLRQECASFVNCRILEQALSSCQKIQDLYQYSDSSFNSLYPRREDNLSHYHLEFRGTSLVHTDTLDTVIFSENLLPPQLMKIDAEGSELPILQGAKNVLREHRPLLIVEQSWENTQNAGYHRKMIREFLADIGYQIYGLSRSSDTCLYEKEVLNKRSIWNLVAVARDEDKSLLSANRPDR